MTITQERKSTETLVRAAVNAVNDGEFDLRDAARSMVNTIAAERGLLQPWDTPDLGLPLLPSVADIGDVHQFSLAHREGQRLKLGSYYTPEVLADTTARFGLHMPLETRHPLEIVAVDPACGAGALLVPTARRITLAYLDVEFDAPEPAEWMVRAAFPMVCTECVFGVDIDEVAVDLCKSALWLESGGVPPITWMDRNIICADALSDVVPPRLAERMAPPVSGVGQSEEDQT